MTRLLALAILVSSCGGPAASEPSTPQHVERHDAPPADEAVTPIVALHEWGLVDVDLAAGTAELSAGPGMPARPVVARKPVVYAHLIHRESASLDLRVRLAPGASVLEHWPRTELEGNVIAWHLDVRRGVCPERGPMRDDAMACDAPDGFCEVSELPRYVTSDYDCMQVGSTSAPLLFYRASIPLDALPVRVERGADLRVRVTSLRDRDGPRSLLRISTGMQGPAGPSVIARGELPSRAATTELAVGQAALDPIAEHAALERTLTAELGLTQDEARAFLDAWAGELFGSDATRESTRRWAPRVRAQDFVLYWLGPSDVVRLAALDASPHAIETHRAFLVRVSFAPVATAGPAAL